MPSLTRASLCRQIDLLRLARADCAALVASLLPGGTPDDELLDRIYALSLGNALFAQELVQSMKEAGLTLHESRWMAPAADTAVPPQVRDLITERITRLPEPTQQVLSLAAAAGMESEYAVLHLAARLEEGALLLLGRLEEGERALEGALPLVEATGNLDLLRRALQNAGCAAAYLGKVEPQRRYFERALELAERVGNPDQIAFALGNLGHALTLLGDWEAAHSHLDRAVDLARSGGQKANLAAPLTMRGVLAVLEGEWERAGQLLQESLALAEETGNRQAQEQAQANLADLELLEGRVGQAAARLEGPATQDDVELLVLAVRSRALLEAGDAIQAERVIDRAVSRGREGEPLTLPELLRVQGRVRARLGRIEEAEESFAEALGLARSMAAQHAEALILYEMGLLSSQRGEQQEARRYLQDALAIFRRLGARPYVERTEQALMEGPNTGTLACPSDGRSSAGRRARRTAPPRPRAFAGG